MHKGFAIGIDLGTTYSCVGVLQHGNVEIIANEQGNRVTPSYVAFTNKEHLIGDAAKNQAAMNPTNTVFDAKRLIGRRFMDEEVRDDMKRWPFRVIDVDGKPKIRVEHCGEMKYFFAEEISSMVLLKMKETAERYLGEKVNDAVITVPAYFNDGQRQATIDAGKIAGLNVLRIINEPTAAAIAYGLDKRIDKQDNLLIFDLGGGTFDVSILSIENGVFKVKSTDGDTHLGGEDFDSLLVDHFAEIFKQKHRGKDLTTSKRAISRLRKACEVAKKTLSTTEYTDVVIETLFEGIDFSEKLSRTRFEQLCSDLFNRTLEPVKRALSDANLGEADVKEIVLVGGSTRIPKVQKLLEELFGGRKLNRSINADEAVAYGAALLAAKLTGVGSEAINSLVLLEVTPLSLGVATGDDELTIVVERNTPIPTKQTKIFTTGYDDRTALSIQVYEGECEKASDNHLLGQFKMSNIIMARRGEPRIEVTFDIDLNGILTVSAVEESSGSQNSITITNNKGRLSAEEIKRMIEKAKKFK